MNQNRVFNIRVVDLNYDAKPDKSIEISEISFSRLPYRNGCRVDNLKYARYIYERITEKQADLINFRLFSIDYNRQIAEKYNMPLDWHNNRWFVEQVRPTL